MATLAVPAAGAGLSDRNSVPVAFATDQTFEVKGVGCGASATGSVTLPPPRRGISAAYRIKVAKPKVGDRDNSVRVTGVQVAGQTITVTATLDAANCSALGPEEPPAQYRWAASFKPDVSFFRHIQVGLRNDIGKKTPTLKAPRRMRLFTGETLTGIRWKGFGSKKAVGVGRYHANIPGTRCNPKLCRGDNSRVKIKLGNVGTCSDKGGLEYRSIRVSFRGGLIFSDPRFCT